MRTTVNGASIRNFKAGGMRGIKALKFCAGSHIVEVFRERFSDFPVTARRPDDIMLTYPEASVSSVAYYLSGSMVRISFLADRAMARQYSDSGELVAAWEVVE